MYGQMITESYLGEASVFDVMIKNIVVIRAAADAIRALNSSIEKIRETANEYK